VVLREIPQLLDKEDPERLFLDLLVCLEEEQDPAMLTQKWMHVLAEHACHNSIRAGQTLSRQEMDALLRLMEKTDYSAQCNHGRPTYIMLHKKDIDKLFHRS